jgi:hypothetical protein
MALNNGVGFAGDPVQDFAPAEEQSEPQAPGGRHEGLPPSGGLPSRYSRGTPIPVKPAAKNYRDQLFAEEDAAKPRPSSGFPWDSEAPADAPARAAVQPESRKLQMKPAAADARTYAPNARGAKPVPESADRKVIQAGYDKLPQAAERKLIQQVRSDGSKRFAAPQMPGLGSSKETPSSPAEASGKSVTPARGGVADTGPQTPQVTIEWAKKGDINVGQECQFELRVKNTGSVTASDVAVDGVFPSTVRLTSAEPKPIVSGEKVTWSFESLAPGAEHKIAVKLIPSRRGELGAVAHVRFTGMASASFHVEEPLLKVALKGPAEVLLGDPASQMILVSNPGTGTVHDVKVEARISDGLEHGSRGERLIMEVGSIGPGETRTVRLGLASVKGGRQSISVAATSSSDAGATASAELNIVAPSMKIAVDGPALRYKGRHAKYTLNVTNDGSVPNNNIRIAQAVAEGFKFVSADHNGKYDSATKSVQWFVGRLEPGQTVQVACELNAVAIGDFSQTVSVLSDSGIRAEAKTQTRVDGIASLTMELVDLDDPVEIGAETAYEIRVKNEGSKTASGVSIACELPPEMELKTVKAPVDAIVEGRQILFKSLDQIAPGAVIVYRVQVKGVQEGNHRMRVRMTGGNLQEPVVREEATKVYADTK